ncbi:MAG: LysM peptidoglycan-binding domain-containing protein [Jatrophihabitans sp.]
MSRFPILFGLVVAIMASTIVSLVLIHHGPKAADTNRMVSDRSLAQSSAPARTAASTSATPTSSATPAPATTPVPTTTVRTTTAPVATPSPRATTGAPTTGGPSAAQSVTYVVKPGDNLTVIAQWFKLHGYGNLYEQNKAVIGDNPNLIFPGQKITIAGGKMTVGG